MIRFLIPLILFSSISFSQLPDTTQKQVRIKSKNFFNVNFIDNGFGLSFTHYKRKNYKVFKSTSFSASHIKHPKEVKIPTFLLFEFIPYKLNHIYIIQLSQGKEKLLIDHPIPKTGIKIYKNTTIGTTVAIEKPVYIDYWGPYNYRFRVPYNPDVHTDYHRITDVYPLRGFLSPTFKVGLSSEFSLAFEFWGEKSGYNQIHLGFNPQCFIQPVEIMYKIDPSRFFLNLFIRYSVGQHKAGY